jgi:hypothetical protein
MNPIALRAAYVAVQLVRYPQGALIENEIYGYLENTLKMDPSSEEAFAIGDEALALAGIMLGLGPDAL